MIKAKVSPAKISFYLMGHRIVSTALCTLVSCSFIVSVMVTLSEIRFILQ